VSVVIVFIAVIGAIVIWWLSQQGLTTKPWLEEGPLDDLPGSGSPPLPPAKIGLRVFLAVVAALFSLFASAYVMRMHLEDWRSLPVPNLLWLNTAVLIASSVALQWARMAAHRGQMETVRTALFAGGVLAATFLFGQLLAWRELVAAGYFLASNPSNSFFYVFTAVHGLHIAGGLVALGRTASKVWHGVELGEVQLSVDLCAVYWHFLLLIWIALFGLFLLT